MSRYIKIENNEIMDYSIEQLLIDYPDAVIYYRTQMPNEKLLSIYNVYPLITEAKPHYEEDETVEEGTPVFENNEWHQTWNVRKLTQEEKLEIEEERKKWFVDSDTASSRLEICETCDRYIKLTSTCKECMCFMKIKTTIKEVYCPLNKW
jgi:hypothetical protein